ncbi:hypothetical protein [Halegenticoccus tardaugens]|uniref:hypothetical protein n=1 Tax=Halegenticoccus tardaugens TaxID=2071624 RepID=UPI0013E90AD7|nr:hypothetical protein [Halegenticoccus tardaugens]
MSSPRRSVVGRGWIGSRGGLWLILVVTLFAATAVAYALGVFAVSGGVVFVPEGTALVGVVAAGLSGYDRRGPVAAWLVASAPLLGFRAFHAFTGLSYRSFSEQLTYFLEPRRLTVLAVEGLALGLLAFFSGSLVRRGVDVLRSDPT